MTEPPLPLFYQRPRPITPATDSAMSLSTHRDYRFAAATNAVPLLATEFTPACKQYPIVFAPGDGAQPLALLGLRINENKFVDIEGRWTPGFHVPAYVRRYPFIFMQSNDHLQFTLCIDAAASTVLKGTDNPFFKNSEPTALTRNALEFCRQFQGDYQYTIEFAKAVTEADLLVDNRADITLGNGEKISLAGFKIIDEQRFNRLDDQLFLEWRDRGWLHLVYSHLMSMGNWNALIDRTT